MQMKGGKLKIGIEKIFHGNFFSEWVQNTRIEISMKTEKRDNGTEIAVMKRRLLPIYSCGDCHYLGKEVVKADEKVREPGRFTTYCTHLAGCTKTIKHGIKETPEHYIFPEWCLLTEE